jgi:hypothetical protein
VELVISEVLKPNPDRDPVEGVNHMNGTVALYFLPGLRNSY